jgi:hypothetical protein
MPSLKLDVCPEFGGAVITCSMVLVRHMCTVHVTATCCCCCCCFFPCCTGGSVRALPARPVMRSQQQAPAGPAQLAHSTSTATARSPTIAHPASPGRINRRRGRTLLSSPSATFATRPVRRLKATSRTGFHRGGTTQWARPRRILETLRATCYGT